MSKAKAYTKMILDRLNKKAQNDNYKVDHFKSQTNSNQKTQSTPSEHHPRHQNVRNFFDNFQKNCAVYHEPTTMNKKRKPMKRPLFFQLSDMKNQAYRMQKIDNQEIKARMITEPYKVSEFAIEDMMKVDQKIPRIQSREHKSTTTRRMEEPKVSRSNSINQGLQYINRYRSLKTLPSKSTIEGSSHRRILVTSSQINLERRNSFEKKEFKMDRKRPESRQPRRQLMRRCESFEKFMICRGQ